jgi:hypothetical protein
MDQMQKKMQEFVSPVPPAAPPPPPPPVSTGTTKIKIAKIVKHPRTQKLDDKYVDFFFNF